MTAFHNLGILSTSFTCNAFPTVLKEFPHMLSTCWLLFLPLQSNSSQTISIGLRSGDCGGQVIWCSTITLLLNQIVLTQPGGVIVLLKTNYSPTKCPVALTSVIMKFFERLVKDHISSILPDTLGPLQFAYRPNRSTDDAIAISLHTALSPIWTRGIPM